MRKAIVLFTLSTLSLNLFSQNKLNTIIEDSEDSVKLPGVSALLQLPNGSVIGGISDDQGNLIINEIPDGEQQIVFSYLGYLDFTLQLNFPLKDPSVIFIIKLESSGIELEEFVVSSTRTSNRVEDIPLKIEILGGDEIEEKSTMQPGNISMMLTEYTGIQAQQTSVTSGNVNIKIQGLNGKYTQILKDGFPVFGGFSGELSLMQTPPLDLKQVEIIKGSASTLYGGDAIAGLVNLISREPGEKEELTLILNQTTLDGTDFSSFYSKRDGKLGITLMSTGTKQTAVDVNKDFFTDIPEQERISVNPKLFFYFNDSSILSFSIYSGFETRVGGDIVAINDQPDLFHNYVEKNKSSRNYTTLNFEKHFRNGNKLTIKNSLNHFNRSIERADYKFQGVQLTSYSEASYLSRFKKHDVVTGINILNDIFTENKNITIYDRDYTHFTVGGFVQDDWQLNEKITLQSGMRVDYQQTYGIYGLPHLSLLLKTGSKFTTRIGGGFGYKIPNIFADETEATAYKNVRALSPSVKAETSKGANVDLMYQTRIGDNASFTINENFFYTQIENPMVLHGDSLSKGIISYTNASKNIVTRGAETNLNIYLGELNLVVGYTFTDAKKLYDTINTTMSLNAANRLMMDFFWNHKNRLKFGFESFYTGEQHLSDYTTRPAYWTVGFLVQKIIKNYSFTMNFENLFDERQTRYESVIIPPVNNPQFKEVWAPLDGFVANFSIKITI